MPAPCSRQSRRNATLVIPAMGASTTGGSTVRVPSVNVTGPGCHGRRHRACAAGSGRPTAVTGPTLVRVEHHESDEACELARGAVQPPTDGRTLVAVFASPVADHLLHFARDL